MQSSTLCPSAPPGCTSMYIFDNGLDFCMKCDNSPTMGECVLNDAAPYKLECIIEGNFGSYKKIPSYNSANNKSRIALLECPPTQEFFNNVSSSCESYLSKNFNRCIFNFK